MSEFTQGVCADGAAILKDGVMLTIEEIIELLRQGDALMGRGEPVGWHVTYTNGFDFMTDDIDELGDADDVESIEPLYKHRAPAVDDAVVRDAERYCEGRTALLDFAITRWHESVANRPLINVHRRTLDDVWREVVTFAGGDSELLLGPRHDAMLAEQEAIKGEG